MRILKGCGDTKYGRRRSLVAVGIAISYGYSELCIQEDAILLETTSLAVSSQNASPCVLYPASQLV